MPFQYQTFGQISLHKGDVTDLYSAFTIIPTMRPKVAPIAIEGTKIPAGTLHPYDTMTSKTRIHVASRSEFTMRHCADVL